MLSPGDRLGRYEVLSQAGAGGMGVVYRARDPLLQRDVALKTLSPGREIRPDQRQRFLQEALMASSLAHQNIVVVHDAGREGETDFIAMEFLNGRTLDRLAGGAPLPVRDAVRYAIQIASALEAAHAAGIVHRDLKPTNVMVTDSGLVKVLDFGLAKTAPLDLEANDDATVTGAHASPGPTTEGAVVGSAAYMSPEQAEARPVDARSDIFSFGSVLYEMLTGRAAFRGDSGLSTMVAVLRDTPAPPSRIAGGVPPELDAIVSRCLEKFPERRYASVSDVRAALERIAGSSSGSYSGASQPPARTCPASIAVLPFANLSSDKENEFFSDGLTEEIMNSLAKIEGLRVTARTSAFAFRGKDQDVRVIARALNVDTVLEGSVRRAGNRVRVAAQLIKAADGYHLWSDRYDRELTDIFAIQDDIAASIVKALREHVGRCGMPAVRERRAPNLEAHTALLRGRYHLFRFTGSSWRTARESFEEAVRRDPEYAEAYVMLATYHASEWALDLAEPKEAVRAARAAAERALAIDGGRGDAHAVIATIQAAYEYDWEAAGRTFARALELDPASAEGMLLYAYWFLRPRGRLHEARQMYRRVLEADPLSPFVHHTLAETYYFEGRYERMIECAGKAIEIDAGYWPGLTMMATGCILSGQVERGREFLVRAMAVAPDETTVRLVVAMMSAVAGDTGPACRVIGELESRSGWRRIPSMLAALYGATGDLDAAFRNAGEMIELRSARALWLGAPMYAPLRAHPGFGELLARMNLDPGALALCPPTLASGGNPV